MPGGVGVTLHEHSPWRLEIKAGKYYSIMESLGIFKSTIEFYTSGGQVIRINRSLQKRLRSKRLYLPMHEKCCTKYNEYLDLHTES